MEVEELKLFERSGVEPSPTTVTVESQAQEHVLQPADTATADGIGGVGSAIHGAGSVLLGRGAKNAALVFRGRAAGGEEKEKISQVSRDQVHRRLISM